MSRKESWVEYGVGGIEDPAVGCVSRNQQALLWQVSQATRSLLVGWRARKRCGLAVPILMFLSSDILDWGLSVAASINSKSVPVVS